MALFLQVSLVEYRGGYSIVAVPYLMWSGALESSDILLPYHVIPLSYPVISPALHIATILIYTLKYTIILLLQ